jgi:OFA family oxalate/formate antiporter-like MFS transporter
MMASVLEGHRFAPDWMRSFGRFLEPVGILALFNAIGRIFWGKVSDLIDRPRAMMIMFLLQGMVFMMLPSAQSNTAIFLASALVGLNFGGCFALFPALTADCFGTRNFGVNYGWVFTAYGVAGIIGPIAGGILFDITGQYVLAFVFAGTLCFLAAGTSVGVWGLARMQAAPPVARGAPR